ncbi:MAG: 16S rRNA (adenine(1518)-N(6)/adenine(1519)-N(6))-dimethyltransferase RsmA [Coriobacteriia bacterium]|nr:16S rRNA (adenine(1518)-N(6)/adenine(1519)-N(6))-dimethyltransferase RsmA [Coriobacteriia bacterium]
MTRYSPLATPAATIEYLKQWGLHTNKSLGQHFLIDDGIVGRILKCADIKPDDRIIEVGPGIGTLTAALLAQGAMVYAIEKDQKLLNPLAVSFANEQGFVLIPADALDIPEVKRSASDTFGAGGKPLKLVANLPYAVAATIVLSYFEQFPTLGSATVMVQREVAERMMAQPNSKEYGAYTVKLRLLAEPQDSFAVARTNFLPPPRVDSTVICLHRHTSSIPYEMYKATSFVVEAAFAQRRKTIRNSMRAHFFIHNHNTALVDTLLARANIDPQRRGETLSVQEFIALGSIMALLEDTAVQLGSE